RKELFSKIEADSIDFYPEYGKYANLHLVYPTESDTDKALASFVTSYQEKGKFPVEAKHTLARIRFFYHLKRQYMIAIEGECGRQEAIKESGSDADYPLTRLTLLLTE